MGICLKEPIPADASADAVVSPDGGGTSDGGDGATELDVGLTDADEQCPIVNGACTADCRASNGRRYEPVADCVGPKVLLTCYDQFDTPSDQPDAMVAPDQSCWVVYPASYKLNDAGWTSAASGGPCDAQAMLSAPACP